MSALCGVLLTLWQRCLAFRLRRRRLDEEDKMDAYRDH